MSDDSVWLPVYNGRIHDDLIVAEGVLMCSPTVTNGVQDWDEFWLPPGYAICQRHPAPLSSVLVCANDKCGWTGWPHESVHPKHDPSTLLCPECHETTEQMTPGWANSLLYLSKRPQPTMDDIIASNQELIVVLRATLAQPQPVANLSEWIASVRQRVQSEVFDVEERNTVNRFMSELHNLFVAGHPQPVAQRLGAPDRLAWMPLHALRPGLIFVTRDGIIAVKSEYRYPNGGPMCVLLSSGEYAHFDDGYLTEVSPLELKELPWHGEKGE